MGTQIQEPNQIDPTHVTDENAGNIALVAYEKSQDGAGLKTLGLALWKDFMNFNGFAVKNVAALSGFPKSTYNVNREIVVPEEDTLVSKVNAIASNAGVSTELPAGPYTPVSDRVTSLENIVGTPTEGGTPATHLCADVENNTSEINAIWTELGQGGGSGGPNINERLTTVEGYVETLNNDVETPVTGLKSIVGDGSFGLTKDVSDLKDTVGNGSSGLVKDVSDLQTTVGDNTSGLVKDVADNTGNITALQGVVGDNTSGLVKDVNDLKQTAASAYVVKGTLTQNAATAWTNTDYENMKNGDVWNVDAVGQTGNTISIPTPASSALGDKQTFLSGANIVWIKGQSGIYTYGYFDQLSSEIVDKRVGDLEGNVTALQTEVFGDATTTGLITRVTSLEENTATVSIEPSHSQSWSSTTENGAYIVTGLSSQNKLVSAIVYITMGKVLNNNVIQLGTEAYINIFTIANDGTINSVATASNFNITKIGG